MKKENFDTPEWRKYFEDKSPEEIKEIKKTFGEKIGGKENTQRKMEEKRLNDEEEVDLRDYLKVMGKRKWTIFITLIVCVFFSSLFTFLQKPVYRAKSAFEIGSTLNSSLMSQEATVSLCKSDYLLNKVKENLGLAKKKKIKVKVESNPGSLGVTISLESSLPEETAKIANSISNLIVKEQNTLYQEKIEPLKNEIKGIQKQIKLIQSKKEEPFSQLLYLTQLQTRFDEIQTKIASFNKSKVIFPAIIPEEPIKPRPIFNLAISVILGLFFGLFFAFFQEYLSKTHKSSV